MKSPIEVADTFFSEYLEILPFRAPEYGRHENSHRGDCEGFDESEKQKLLNLYSKTRLELQKTQVTNQDQQDTLEVLKWDVETKTRKIQSHWGLLPFHQLDSRIFDLFSYGAGNSYQIFNSEEDCQKWLQKVDHFPKWVDAVIERMRQGVHSEITWPKEISMQFAQPLRNLISKSPEESHLYPPFEIIDSPSLKSHFGKVLNSQINAPLQKLVDFLDQEYVRSCRDTTAVCDLKTGEDLYDICLNENLGESVDIKWIHQMGLDAVAEINSKKEICRKKISQRKSFFSTREEALQFYRETQKIVDSKLLEIFERVPKLPCIINEVEEYKANESPSAYYRSGDFERNLPGIFYLNTHNLKRNPPNRTRTLYLHEANPGHHLQVSWAMERKAALGFYRAYLFNSGCGEGWALYAEHLGNELGLFEDPIFFEGHLQDQMLRAVRLVVDTGLHCFGWTPKRAAEYMVENCEIDPAEAWAEVYRYLVIPGQALGYYYGFQKFLQWRKSWEKKGLQLKDFHTRILDAGTLTLSAMEKRVQSFMKSN